MKLNLFSSYLAKQLFLFFLQPNNLQLFIIATFNFKKSFTDKYFTDKSSTHNNRAKWAYSFQLGFWLHNA